ncbi:uncharacterized protein LOC129363099 isoform X1 [Poeciliopsis prolifica]|uniref:uncharacterized protein LOC129363099 isoform X1 n=1 Tax=Poeciliopsis prolifica TaxID=188132 RepID=UPI002413626B|nr:uncharacterized protein LOC129363099 isoform X1 [Poeciliopsis prolifica]
MKRRSSLRSDSGQEERRLDGERNLRKRQWINYRDDDEDDYEEDDRNQPLTHEDGELWPVTCGVKEGMMDAQKLAKGEKCIEFEGRMFTPPAFEEFGGRGSAKKWKLSIYSGGKPLQHWFDENLLSTEGYRKGKKAYKKGQSFQNNGDNGDAQGSGESGEDATDDSENDDGIPSGCRSWLSWAEEETERNDSDHSDEKQDEEPDEMEKDGDGNDEDDENLCAPQEPDPRFIISTTEKLALQMNSIVLLERISMTRSRCQTAAAEHQRKDDEEGDGDSETNRNEKTKSNEGETPQEPVDSETADVATNTSPQQEPAEQKVHELQVCRASCRHFDSAWFERTRRSHGCEHLGSIRITDEVGDEKRLRFGKHSHLGHSGELHVWGLDRFRRGLDGSGSAAERNSENAAGSCKRAKGGFENTEGILRFEIASFTSSDESGSFQFADAGCDATNSGRNGAFPVTRNYKELIILLPSSQEKL